MKATSLIQFKKLLNTLNNQRPEHVSDMDAVYASLKSILGPNVPPMEQFKQQYDKVAGLGEANALKIIDSIMATAPPEVMDDAIDTVKTVAESVMPSFPGAPSTSAVEKAKRTINQARLPGKLKAKASASAGSLFNT